MRVKSQSACENRALRVNINLVRVEITLVPVVFTFMPVKITLYVWKSHSACINHNRSCRTHTRECHIHTHTFRKCVCGNHTLRVKSHSEDENCTLRVEITLVRVEIELVRVVITFVSVKFTLCVQITVCVATLYVWNRVYYSHSSVSLSHS
jgi:hypothetical protein